jgi:hypothetical protein
MDVRETLETISQVHLEFGHTRRVSSWSGVSRCHMPVDPIVNCSILSDLVALRRPLRTYGSPNSKPLDGESGQRENFSPLPYQKCCSSMSIKTPAGYTNHDLYLIHFLIAMG